METPSPRFLPLQVVIERKDGALVMKSCVYLVEGTRFCRKKLAETSHKEALRICSSVLAETSESGIQSPDFLQTLHSLAKSRLCSSHGKLVASALLQWHEEWKRDRPAADVTHNLERTGRLARLVYTDDANSSPCERDKDEVVLQTIELVPSDHELSESSSVELDEDAITVASSALGSPNSTFDIDSLPIECVPCTNLLELDQVSTWVAAVLGKPLQEKAKKLGWIYVIGLPILGEGMYKVGCTENEDPRTTRYKDHKKCYGEYQEIFRAPIQNAQRVEKVLLAEFRNEHHMLKNPCGCGDTRHQELLKTDGGILHERVKAWVKFFAENPYDKNSSKLRGDMIDQIPLAGVKAYFDRKPASLFHKKINKTPKSTTPKAQGSTQRLSGDSPPALDLTKSSSSASFGTPSGETSDETGRISNDTQLSPSPTPSKNRRGSSRVQNLKSEDSIEDKIAKMSSSLRKTRLSSTSSSSFTT
ncbi:hypothetical protein PDE_00961 [Penicillium oxalicum 114-2]|uniref:Bacteriophage T5 Orf172 DNA-binding domain-containing protein n=1 Tax=Penicillium oxalicum (strain 114-2 / CGMCC 5302) TaxID=933388 RepID=S7Z657_PENO1|nr:hypothetical protein PDE_00961 [Penicillium oxalicum 114-2]